MLISWRSDHKKHLSFLTTQPVQVIVDFCKLAIDFLQNGPNQKLYTTAAEKLSTEVETIQNCVYGIVNLLLLSCKHKLSDADFRDSILTLGFDADQQAVFNKLYGSKREEISKTVHNLKINEPHYDNLEWRFEVQIASRSLLEQVTPFVAMDLSLKTLKEDCSEHVVEHKIIQTDITNLVHITQELERALAESRSRHARKIGQVLNN